MSWKEALKVDMLNMIKRQGYDAVSVESWEEVQMSDGYCDTCYCEWTAVNVLYSDSDDKFQKFYYSGSLSELLNELARQGEDMTHILYKTVHGSYLIWSCK